MSLDWFGDVLTFHRKLAPGRIGSTPAWPDGDKKRFVDRLVVEEWNELVQADKDRDLVETTDATLDLIYVLLGRLITLGIDPRPAWDAIQASNIAKEGGETRPDGKVGKPLGWEPPDIAGILAGQPPLSVR